MSLKVVFVKTGNDTKEDELLFMKDMSGHGIWNLWYKRPVLKIIASGIELTELIKHLSSFAKPEVYTFNGPQPNDERTWTDEYAQFIWSNLPCKAFPLQ